MRILMILSLFSCFFLTSLSCKSDTNKKVISNKEEIVTPSDSINTDTDGNVKNKVVEMKYETDQKTSNGDEIVNNQNADQSQLDIENSSGAVNSKSKPSQMPNIQTPVKGDKSSTGEHSTNSTSQKDSLKENNEKPAQMPNIQTPVKLEEPSEEANSTIENHPEEKPAPLVQKNIAPNHKAFNNLLKEFVSPNGKVDYSNFKKNEFRLNEYLTILTGASPGSDWSRDENLAFWINAYNAYTIKLILDNWPVQSITDLHNGKPWDVKWIKLGGKTLSLNNIENDIIRPTFNEPRIHFAVNCAAQSCPPLLNGAYFEDKIDVQLENQTKKFVNNSKFNNLSENKLRVSKIFEWYGKDFSNVAAFISKYAKTDVSGNASVSFMEYDWALNN